jgi:2,5-diketo-D-gluconate reductase A
VTHSFTPARIGLGLFKVPVESTQALVEEALDVGYRHFDCASNYGNEAQLGAALTGSGLDRSSFTVTSKAWIDELGSTGIRDALHRSLDRLGLDFVDIYIIHWPAPERDLYVDSFREMLVLKQEGLIKNVGVSNFHVDYLERLRQETGSLPVINQVERHPYLQQHELFVYHSEHGIASQAWGPLARGEVLADARLSSLADRAGASIAQLVLAWQLSSSVSVIPKASSRQRLEENLSSADVELPEDIVREMAEFDRDYRTGPNPADKN